MPVRALAGTVGAHARCFVCGHSRIRHEARGTGRCTTVVSTPVLVDNQAASNRLHSCPCRAFREGA